MIWRIRLLNCECPLCSLNRRPIVVISAELARAWDQTIKGQIYLSTIASLENKSAPFDSWFLCR